MENTIRNKVKFMSAYMYCANIYIEFENSPQHNYGQRLTPTALGHVEFGKQLFFGGTYPNIERAYLILKPLSSISDEDAIEIAKIENDFTDPIKRGKSIIGIIERDFVRFNPSIIIKIIDYLRSKGYALPFMGLSVEELVNRGWVKLKGGQDE